jgi:orotate phosphoribosyltransferase-like protein
VHDRCFATLIGTELDMNDEVFAQNWNMFAEDNEEEEELEHDDDLNKNISFEEDCLRFGKKITENVWVLPRFYQTGKKPLVCLVLISNYFVNPVAAHPICSYLHIQ